MTVPVVFLVFNRPECTARVFAEIRRARPPRLLVVADGPRPDRLDDLARCTAVRQIIDAGVDWPCVIERDYAAINLGCARRVASGLDWAFSRAERLIVLEDDCLPDPSFFPFCEELLARYADDTRVGQICGCPRYFSRIDRSTSYIFSRYGPIWGWASWRRAWTCYDLEMKSWPAFRESGKLQNVTQSAAEFRKRTALYDQLHAGNPSTWDYQWGYAKLANNLLSIIPTANLIENIGFDGDGTHYSGGRFELERAALAFPLKHPPAVTRDINFDSKYSAEFMALPNILVRILKKVTRFLGRRSAHV